MSFVRLVGRWGLAGRSAREMPIGKEQAFRLARAELTNVRTAWDGIRADGTIVFMGWQDNFRKNGARYECLVWQAKSPAVDRIGANQRWRNISRLMESGESALLLVAIAADTTAETREVSDVLDAIYTVSVEERSGDYYAVAQRRDPLL